MKNSELIILETYLNNWLASCNQKIEICAIQSNNLAKELLENRIIKNPQIQIENNIYIMRKTTEVFQKINEITIVKASVYEMLSFIRTLEVENEIDIIDVATIKPYVYERLLDQFITMLEEKEMYEACVLIKNHLLTSFNFNRDAA